MAALTQNPASRTKGGGNKVLALRIQRNVSTGAFEAFSGSTDELGGAAGTFHQVGSFESTDIPRADNGSHSIKLTAVEFDISRKNLAINAAPFSSTASAKKEELDLEDGTNLESTDSSSEDTGLPYWLTIVRGAPVAGKEQAFYCVAQLSRAMSYGGSKANAYNKPVFTFNTVDAGGFVATNPATGEAWLTDVTAPTLADEKAHGIWVEGT